MIKVAHCSLVAAALIGAASASAGAPELPGEFWWYWDRPAAQLPTPAPDVGAAVVVMHVYLSGARASRVPRRSALPLPPGVAVVPVVHVEVDRAVAFAGSEEQMRYLGRTVIDAARRAASGLVQLDFEARKSQREFWRATVGFIKAGLPAGTRLSVTALASWCHEDRWLSGLPVDEIVPMYFRLGRARDDYVARSAAGVGEPRCALAHGLADDEAPWPVKLPGRRYLFLGKRSLSHPSTFPEKSQ